MHEFLLFSDARFMQLLFLNFPQSFPFMGSKDDLAVLVEISALALPFWKDIVMPMSSIYFSNYIEDLLSKLGAYNAFTMKTVSVPHFSVGRKMIMPAPKAAIFFQSLVFQFVILLLLNRQNFLFVNAYAQWHHYQGTNRKLIYHHKYQ